MITGAIHSHSLAQSWERSTTDSFAWDHSSLTQVQKNVIHLNLERIANLQIKLQQGKQDWMCGIIPNLVRTCGFFLSRHHSVPTGVLDSPWQASLWLERCGTSRQIHSQFAEGAHSEHIQISARKSCIWKQTHFQTFFLLCNAASGWGYEEINCKVEDCCWASHYEECQWAWGHRGASETTTSSPQGYISEAASIGLNIQKGP